MSISIRKNQVPHAIEQVRSPTRDPLSHTAWRADKTRIWHRILSAVNGSRAVNKQLEKEFKRQVVSVIEPALVLCRNNMQAVERMSGLSSKTCRDLHSAKSKDINSLKQENKDLMDAIDNLCTRAGRHLDRAAQRDLMDRAEQLSTDAMDRIAENKAYGDNGGDDLSLEPLRLNFRVTHFV